MACLEVAVAVGVEVAVVAVEAVAAVALASLPQRRWHSTTSRWALRNSDSLDVLRAGVCGGSGCRSSSPYLGAACAAYATTPCPKRMRYVVSRSCRQACLARHIK